MFSVAKKYPVLLSLSGIGPVIAAVLGWLVDKGELTSTQGAYITTVLIALASLYAAIRTDNLSVSLLTGFATTFMTGLVAFGINIAPDAKAVVVAVITFVAGQFLHSQVSPASPS